MSTPRTIREDLFDAIPAGTAGVVEIAKRTESVRGHVSRHVELTVAGVPTMNNGVAEDDSHAELYTAAAGHVLLAGLGLGADVLLLRDKPEVTTIDVVEISPDVIALVGPHVRHPKVRVFQGDALTWVPPLGKRYQTIFFDLLLDDINLFPAERSAMQARGDAVRAVGGSVSSWEHPSIVEV